MVETVAALVVSILAALVVTTRVLTLERPSDPRRLIATFAVSLGLALAAVGGGRQGAMVAIGLATIVVVAWFAMLVFLEGTDTRVPFLRLLRRNGSQLVAAGASLLVPVLAPIDDPLPFSGPPVGITILFVVAVAGGTGFVADSSRLEGMDGKKEETDSTDKIWTQIAATGVVVLVAFLVFLGSSALRFDAPVTLRHVDAIGAAAVVLAFAVIVSVARALRSRRPLQPSLWQIVAGGGALLAAGAFAVLDHDFTMEVAAAQWMYVILIGLGIVYLLAEQAILLILLNNQRLSVWGHALSIGSALLVGSSFVLVALRPYWMESATVPDGNLVVRSAFVVVAVLTAVCASRFLVGQSLDESLGTKGMKTTQSSTANLFFGTLMFTALAFSCTVGASLILRFDTAETAGALARITGIAVALAAIENNRRHNRGQMARADVADDPGFRKLLKWHLIRQSGVAVLVTLAAFTWTVFDFFS